MKKYTVKELAQLLDDYIAIVFIEDRHSWSNPEMFNTIQDLVDKYGERTIEWITFSGSEDDFYQVIVLEGVRE